MDAFGTYQNQYFLGRLGDVVPELNTELWRGSRRWAEERMPATAFGCVASKADSEATARANLQGQLTNSSRGFVPQMLRDVSTTDLSVTVLGTRCPQRSAFAPISVLGIVHPDREARVAAAAASLGLPMVR